MSNFLDLRCPGCGCQARIDVLAEVWVRVTPDGTDADASENGDITYTPRSTATCTACGLVDRLYRFHSDDEEEP
jgi:ribosomal protein S27E